MTLTVAAVNYFASKDGSHNKTNYRFAEFLLAMREDLVNSELLKDFYRLSHSILYKHGWFHPLGIDELVSDTNEVLVEQAARFSTLTTEDIIYERSHNRFAYIYSALANRLVDRIRGVYRARKAASEYTQLSFSSRLEKTDLALHLQRQRNKDLIASSEDRFSHDRAISVILEWAGAALETTSMGQLDRAELVKCLGAELEITPQHARREIVRFGDLCQTDPGLKEIVNSLRQTVAMVRTESEAEKQSIVKLASSDEDQCSHSAGWRE